jgi:hypothetical protein
MRKFHEKRNNPRGLILTKPPLKHWQNEARVSRRHAALLPRSYRIPVSLHLRIEGLSSKTVKALPANLLRKSLHSMKHFSTFNVFTGEEKIS